MMVVKSSKQMHNNVILRKQKKKIYIYVYVTRSMYEEIVSLYMHAEEFCHVVQTERYLSV